jgi:hypothetical protein
MGGRGGIETTKIDKLLYVTEGLKLELIEKYGK